jgi:hypothetical protein
MVRWVVTWFIATSIALLGLTMISLTIGGNIGPLELATAIVIGVVVALRRQGRRRPPRPEG